MLLVIEHFLSPKNAITALEIAAMQTQLSRQKNSGEFHRRQQV
jgi:hypothetical protein